MTLYLTQEDVRKILDMKTTIEVVEYGFREMGQGRVEMPTRIYLHFNKHNGVLIAMPAYIEALDAAGVKVVTVHPDNPSKNDLPSVIARIILNSPAHGTPMAIMDGTHITMLRTGAAGAVGIKYLSRKDSETAAIIGLGVQGRAQLEGLLEVRDIKKVKVFDCAHAKQKAYVKAMLKQCKIDFQPASSVEEAVNGADIIITCTPTSKPFLEAHMYASGTHISAIGADTKSKRELHTSVLTSAGKIVVDSISQALIVGDFAVPLSEGKIEREDIFAELGDIVCGKTPGRTNNDEITVFKATGLAIEDIATAYRVYQLAKKKGIGKEI